jgi:hypothetical protein
MRLNADDLAPVYYYRGWDDATNYNPILSFIAVHTNLFSHSSDFVQVPEYKVCLCLATR